MQAEQNPIPSELRINLVVLWLSRKKKGFAVQHS